MIFSLTDASYTTINHICDLHKSFVAVQELTPMKSKVVRLHGKMDLRLEEIELPKIKDDEILASVIVDSLCMSTFKLAQLGSDHKKSPADLSKNPIIVGHEFCGEILEVGKNWSNKYSAGDRYVVQANLQLKDRPDCPGYSYPHTGGDAQYIILDRDVMEQDCLINYKGDTFFEGALVEPLSCVIAAFKANYHLIPGTYNHQMGIKENGSLLIMGGTGPMGMLSIDYALNGPVNPKKIVVTTIDKNKIEQLRKIYKSNHKTEVIFVDVSGVNNQTELLENINNGGYDDIFIMIPSGDLVTTASNLLNTDGCLNFFAGPKENNFSSNINFYDIHYKFTHYVGTSGGNTDDMREAVTLIENKSINVANIVTHVLGLNDVPSATLNQPSIGGGKKIVYTQKKFDLFNIADSSTDSTLHSLLEKHKGFWSKDAENHVLENYPNI